MNKTTNLAVLLTGVILGGSLTATAQAQTASAAFVDINVGGQTQSRTLASSSSFPLYEETATINGAQAIDGGAFFDFGGGYRFRPNLGAAVGVSVFSKSGDGTIDALIPSPSAFNRSVNISASTSDLKHREIGTHLMVVYFVPIRELMPNMEKVDVVVFAGPSFFRVSQDLISATVPTGTQTISTATTNQKASATGVNAGASINYLVTPKYGVGVFARYAGATANLPTAGDLKVGGFQLGAGLRLRF